jgi:hypothetical protein
MKREKQYKKLLKITAIRMNKNKKLREYWYKLANLHTDEVYFGNTYGESRTSQIIALALNVHKGIPDYNKECLNNSLYYGGLTVNEEQVIIHIKHRLTPTVVSEKLFSRPCKPHKYPTNIPKLLYLYG